MPDHVLERRQTILADLTTVFSFFEDPRNLEQITPPWLNFRVISSTDDRVRQGTRIQYVIRWLGVPMRWESLIARYEPQVCFADEMLRGPYRRWFHVHSFRAVPGGVEMTDRVEYALPLGPLGSLAHRMIVRKQLEAIFDYRERRAREIFAASSTG